VRDSPLTRVTHASAGKQSGFPPEVALGENEVAFEDGEAVALGEGSEEFKAVDGAGVDEELELTVVVGAGVDEELELAVVVGAGVQLRLFSYIAPMILGPPGMLAASNTVVHWEFPDAQAQNRVYSQGQTDQLPHVPLPAWMHEVRVAWKHEQASYSVERLLVASSDEQDARLPTQQSRNSLEEVTLPEHSPKVATSAVQS